MFFSNKIQIEKEITQIKNKIHILSKDNQTFSLPFLKILKKKKETIKSEAKLPTLKLSLNETEEVVKRLSLFKKKYEKREFFDEEVRFSTYDKENFPTECTDEVYNTIQNIKVKERGKERGNGKCLLTKSTYNYINTKNTKILNNSIIKIKKSRNIIQTTDINKQTIETDSPDPVREGTTDNDNVNNQTTKQIEEEVEKLKQELTFLKEKSVSLSKNYENVNIKLSELKYEKEAYLNILDKYIRRYEEYVQVCDVSNSQLKEEEYLKKASLKKKVNRINEDVLFLKKEISISEFIKDSLISDIHKVERELKEKQKEVKEKLDLLSQYYHLTLEKGVEVRKTGLTWVILSIWKIDCEVLLSKLPRFLDISIIKYLFLRAHKEIELMKTERLLLEIKDLVRVCRGKEYRLQRTKKIVNFQRKNLEESVIKYRNQVGLLKENLKQVSKPFYYHKKDENLMEKQGFHAISKYFKSKIDFQVKENDKKEYSNILKYVEDLEAFSQRLNADLNHMKRKEVKRIIYEYLYNNYERRYKVGIEKVLFSVVGEDISEEMKCFYDEQKRFVRDFEVCRCYKK